MVGLDWWRNWGDYGWITNKDLGVYKGWPINIVF